MVASKTRYFLALVVVFTSNGAFANWPSSFSLQGDTQHTVTLSGTGTSTIQMTIDGSGILGAEAALYYSTFATSSESGTYQLTSPSLTPLTLISKGSGNYTVNQTAPLNFSYVGPSGTLTGSWIHLVDAVNVNNSPAGPNLLVLRGGAFIQNALSPGFGSMMARASITLILNGDLNTVVNSANSVTSNLHSGSQIVGISDESFAGSSWFPGPSGAANRTTFAVTAAMKNCSLWGHLLLSDPSAGVQVFETSFVDDYVEGSWPSYTLHLRGWAVFNGKSGYWVELKDVRTANQIPYDVTSITITAPPSSATVYSVSGTPGNADLNPGDAITNYGSWTFEGCGPVQ